MKNNSGKALTIFLVLISVIFVSLTAISVFLLVKQVQLREIAEEEINQLVESETSLRAQLQETKGQNELLVLKAQEAEERIESLLEEIDLANSVRDQVRKENRDLKDSLDSVKKASDDLKSQLALREKEVEERVVNLQNQLDAAIERNRQIEERRQEIEAKYTALEEQLKARATAVSILPGEDGMEGAGVDLDKIVINIGDARETGQVISVDAEADFVVVNLGERDGLSIGKILSIFSGEAHLGDIRVSKTLWETAAADFIPPLAAKDVSEGFLVKIK